MTVYRVPLRRVFNKKKVSGDPSWDEIYGKNRCCRCHKAFSEGDPYQIVTGSGKSKYAHVECS